MFKNLFLKGVYDKRWFIFGWTIGLLAMTCFTIAFFPSFNKGPGLEQLFQNVPKQLQSFVGDISAYSHINGYVASGIYELRVPMLSIPMAIILAIGLGVGEETAGRLDQLLAQPISRTKVIMEKWLTSLFVMASVMVLMAVGIGITIRIIHEHMPFSQQLELLFMCWLLGVTIGTITMMAGAVRGTRGMAALIATFVAFGSYLITSFATQVSWLKKIDYISLFHYYHPSAIVKHGLVASHIMVYLVVIALSLIVAVVSFNNRDIGV